MQRSRKSHSGKKLLVVQRDFYRALQTIPKLLLVEWQFCRRQVDPWFLAAAFLPLPVAKASTRIWNLASLSVTNLRVFEHHS